MDQIELNATEWKPLTVAGKSVIAWLDEDNDGETGGIDDVRFIRASSVPLSAEQTGVMKINTDYGITITPSAACDINIAVLWCED